MQKKKKKCEKKRMLPITKKYENKSIWKV